MLASPQDLGCVSDKADDGLATITAAGPSGPRDPNEGHGDKTRQRAVRANARFNERTIDAPLACRDFLAVLDEATFPALHDVD